MNQQVKSNKRQIIESLLKEEDNVYFCPFCMAFHEWVVVCIPMLEFAGVREELEDGLD